MASMRRLARTILTCRTIASRKTLAPPATRLRHHFSHRSFNHHIHTNASGGYQSRSLPEIPGLYYLPAVVGVLFGVGFNMTDVVYADANEDNSKAPLRPESSSTYVDLEATAKNERARLEELLKRKGMQYGSYPRFTVGVKGQKVTIKFQLPSTCEVALIISNLVSHLGVKVEEHGTGSDMTLRAWDRFVHSIKL